MNDNPQRLPNFRDVKNAEDFERFQFGLKAQKAWDGYKRETLIMTLVIFFLTLFVFMAFSAIVYMFFYSDQFKNDIAQIIVNNIVSAVIVLAGYIGITFKKDNRETEKE